MTGSRTKNATRNILFGFVNRLVTLILPFITRTLILTLLGASFLGIGTLFNSILNFLSLAELGVGSAIVYAMYQPIADGDTEKLCALLKYFRKLYRIIGLVILSIGSLLIPFVPFLIKGDSPAGINIYLLYCAYLINSVISYFFAGYRQSLLTAHQRSDIVSNVATITNLLVQFGQIFVLYLTKNFYAYAIVPLVGTLITNTINYYITKRKFPDVGCEGTIDSLTRTQINKKLTGLFGTKLNSIVVHSADIMVISAFLGLTLTAQYGNYYYIMNAVCAFIAIIFSSMTAGIGNKLVTESKERNYELFKNLSFVNGWLVGWCSVCFLCLYEPFMKIWVGEELCLGLPFVICLILYFFVYEIQRTTLTFKDAAGLWSQDKYRPYVSMIINVTSNLILVNFIGIYGIVVSTIIAFVVSLPWANYVLYKYLFHEQAISNIVRMTKCFVITAIACVATFFACYICPDGIWGILSRLGICLILPNFIFYVFWGRKKEFLFLKQLVASSFKRFACKL